MSKMKELADLGQAIWFDFIRRSFLSSGEFQELIDKGLRGVTSNPSIFEKVIAGSADYDGAIEELLSRGLSDEALYEALAREDIRQAADMLLPLYESSGAADGYVSLEVSPALADDTKGTIDDGLRLFAALDRPNIMIKVPATRAGIPAIEALIFEGVNVNATLIFSIEHYETVAEAYLKGLEKRSATGKSVDRIASVASFFISRIDVAVDRALEQLGETALQGKIAIASAKLAYARFAEIFSGQRWQDLAAKSARVQRLLWASTGTKNPAYPDTLYLDSLVGRDTVNTVPPATLQAFLDHGSVSKTLGKDVEEAGRQVARLDELGIDLVQITQKLQQDGVASFASAFNSLIASIAEKRKLLSAESSTTAESPGPKACLGQYQERVDRALSELVKDNALARIWAGDHSIWKPTSEEITNRLGWLDIADRMRANLPRMRSLAETLRTEGYNKVLLLGMGGSSLAPEMFSSVFGTKEGFLELAVLDSTDPAAVLARKKDLDLAKTLFVVSTKSGGTVETLSFFKYFYNRVAEQVGRDKAGEHFVAITDPGSKLVDLAGAYDFRDTFLNDADIGGRYSALSYFGLVPAALIGLDLDMLLDRALTMAAHCASQNGPLDRNNPAGRLGVIISELAGAGRDKLTLITPPEIAGFGDWVEQLIAESTGKEGRGILPVVGEPLGGLEIYGEDRVFVLLELGDGSPARTPEDSAGAKLAALEKAGHPLLRLNLKDIYDIGAQIFLWEMATAVAGYRLKINPFNQPDVESAKIRAREMVENYQKQGKLPEDREADLKPEALTAFLGQAKSGDYLALHAYVQADRKTRDALQALRIKLRDRLKLATTLGFGPRFLHSTGQLHKGDAGNGLFIQFTSDAKSDIPIPDSAGSDSSSISFGVLKMAQALGDKQALSDGSRRVIRFHLGLDPAAALGRIEW